MEIDRRTFIVNLFAMAYSFNLSACSLSSERIFYTAIPATPVGSKAQIFSMDINGLNKIQHTFGNNIMHNIYACPSTGTVFFSSNDSLSFLNKSGKEETYLEEKGIQHYSPKCSFDGRFLSVAVWDKKNEKAFVEVYELKNKKSLGSWEAESDATWARETNAILYRRYIEDKGKSEVRIYMRDMDEHPEQEKLLYSFEVGEYLYDISEPLMLTSDPLDIIFRAYDEHEYFYYFREVGNSFVLKRDGNELKHHNVYKGEMGPSLEQAQLSLSPDGNFAVFTEHPWNTPPSLYLVDVKTRDSRKIADGFNPLWSSDSRKVFFNKDPKHYKQYAERKKRGESYFKIYPDGLDGYEIYVYDTETKKETRLTKDDKYQGFL